MHTILEIGSGSLKLHQESQFSLRFNSSLGKNLHNQALHPDSVAIALASIKNEIIPFLSQQNIDLDSVLLFATAAVRTAMQDPAHSGENFINSVKSMGFKDIKVFSEDDECRYAALAVIEAVSFNNFLLLDTGGASHQLMEIQNSQIHKMQSFPIGSHSDIENIELPDFSSLGYKQELPLIVIGTTGLIINAIPDISYEQLENSLEIMLAQSIAERKQYLSSLIADPELQKLFVDYRLAVLPNAFKIVKNCAQKLSVTSFHASKEQAINYISKFGF